MGALRVWTIPGVPCKMKVGRMPGRASWLAAAGLSVVALPLVACVLMVSDADAARQTPAPSPLTLGVGGAVHAGLPGAQVIEHPVNRAAQDVTGALTAVTQ
jgi:hypothetical protein